MTTYKTIFAHIDDTKDGEKIKKQIKKVHKDLKANGSNITLCQLQNVYAETNGYKSWSLYKGDNK